MKIGTDWLVKVECPRPGKNVKNEKEHIKACSGCPYVIWKEPEMVAGFMASMCGVRVGSIGMAADLDAIGWELLEIERFTKEDSNAAFKLGILKKIKNHVEEEGWTMEGFAEEETLDHLDKLIEFCRKLEAKGLDIRAWA